jgi:sugar phosphate isomerase/epimerase
VKKRHKCKSDAELARILFTTKQAISMQRHETSSMQMKTAVRTAELLGVDPMLVICGVMHQMAASEADKQFWRDVFKRVVFRGEERRKWLTPENEAEGDQ